MKTFGYPDGSERTLININVAIESTLTVAQGEFKYVADSVTEFSNVPHISGFAGDVNQVLLNLFVNAAHAIADRSSGIGIDAGEVGIRGLITVRTSADDEYVVVEVSDTGTGIPEDVKQRIFDPFFTTKEVGRGTGQGLSLSKGIVERHGGTLTFSTVLGQGTTFFVRLPVGIENL